MELQLKTEQFTYYDATEEAPVSLETTQEAIVPDSCADVERIVDTTGVVLVHSKDVGPDGRLEINGVIKATVLFLPEAGKEPGAVHVSIPFHTAAELKDGAGRCAVRAWLRSIDSRLLNPRKMLTRADLLLEITAYRQKTVQLCTAAEGDETLQVLEDQAETTVLTDVMEREFPYVEEMSVSASRRGIREILDSRTVLFPSETRIIGSKLVLKGIVRGELLCRDTAGEVFHLSQEYLFSQILETGASEDTGFARASFALTGYEYTIGSENDRDDDHVVTMSLHIRSSAEILEKRRLRFLADLYSLSQHLELERQTLSVLEDTRSYTRKQNMREILETGVAVRQVVAAWVQLGLCQRQQGEEGAGVQIPVQLKTLYLDENDQLQLAEKTVQVHGETDDSAAGRIVVSCPGEEASGPAPEGIEVRFALEFAIDTGLHTDKLCIAQVKCSEQPEEEDAMPSIVLRKISDGTRLWDIAKQYRTTGADILAANAMESEDALNGDKLILIPRHRV